VGETEKKDYDAGSHTMTFHSDGIALRDVKDSFQNNCGVLTASLTRGEDLTRGEGLTRGEEDIAQICAVTQVTKGADGELQRRMMSPLE
jgi:hypothetical protein